MDSGVGVVVAFHSQLLKPKDQGTSGELETMLSKQHGRDQGEGKIMQVVGWNLQQHM